MSFAARASSLALAVVLALPALTDDAIVVTAPVAPQAAVIETAKLDAAVIEEAAALELFGLSSAASTALVFIVIAIVVTMATESGDAQGIPP